MLKKTLSQSVVVETLLLFYFIFLTLRVDRKKDEEKNIKEKGNYALCAYQVQKKNEKRRKR